MPPSLSVLITYHNEKELLRECLESLFSGSQAPEEVIIFDDASVHSLKEHIPSTLPVRVLRAEKNVGPSVGRNRLLEECKTDFLHFHDADDWFQVGWYEKVQAALSTDVDAVYTEVASYNEQKESVCPKVLGLSAVTDNQSLIRFCTESFMLVPAGTFRTSLVKELGGYRTSLGNPKILISISVWR